MASIRLQINTGNKKYNAMMWIQREKKKYNDATDHFKGTPWANTAQRPAGV